jgi:hypothetical protein
LDELKSFTIKAFLMPLNPVVDDDGDPIDYSSTMMSAVWDEIEQSGVPVTHHIGETPPKTPTEFNGIAVGMMINIDGFREVFSKYIFGAILDRHPGLRIGWFEGGISWVPWALQDAEHLVASYQHMFNHILEHDVQYYWDTHMSASFMVDPLGLELIDKPAEHDRQPAEDRRRRAGSPSRLRRPVAELRQVAADGFPERRPGRRRADDTDGAACQDAGRDCRASGVDPDGRGWLGRCTGLAAPGGDRADTERGDSAKYDGRRCQQSGQSGRRLDHLEGPSVAPHRR